MEKNKILIVDDEPRNQRIISEVLEDNFIVKMASDGETALSIHESFNPDLVFLDIMMPGIDGYEVCKKIKNDPRFRFTKVILVSGKAMIDERLKGYSAGADDYITKPFIAEELLAKAKVFLHLTNTEKELDTINKQLENIVNEKTQKLLDAEARLINSDKLAALGEMAGGIAHEINTPLGIIRLIAGQIEKLLMESPPNHPKISEMLVVVDKTIRRISNIINGLRTFSRDGSQDEFIMFPLQAVIDDTITLCKEKLNRADIELRIDSFSKDLMVHCRPVQISQVLLNLINNSYDAISLLPAKWIQISVEQKSGQVRVSITDCGNGIPENILNKIFQPFYTTKELGKGTGLGLSISKGIMEAHSGNLSYDMDCPNTRFTITLLDHKKET